MPQAASLAAAIEKEFGTKASLKKGRGGVFEVTVNGKLVFDKHEKGRFPEAGEVLDEIRKLV
ncbi:MAG: Rdx family protein [bacterium]|nr:Rdx family protein [bacterium]